MVLIGGAESTPERFVIYGSILAVLLGTLALFLSADALQKLLRASFQMVATRLLGLILLAFGVQFVATGIQQLAS